MEIDRDNARMTIKSRENDDSELTDRSRLRCRDIMTSDVAVVTRAMSLHEVANMMRDGDTGIIPVIENMAPTSVPGEVSVDAGSDVRSYPKGNGELVGLITDRDIVVRAVAEGKNPETVRAEEIMTTEIHSARPDDRVIDVIRMMGDKQVRRIPVVSETGELCGIISMADVVLETEADHELASALEEISSGASFWNRVFGGAGMRDEG